MLDWSRVDALKAELGEEDFDEIVALFLEEGEEKLSDLTSSGANNHDADLHFLKGSAANLGFEQFRATCEQMEHQPDQFAAGQLQSVYQQSKSAFLAGKGG